MKLKIEESVQKFVRGLEKLTISKFIKLTDLLEKFVYQLPMPYSKKISNRLFELRIRGQQEVRIFYTFHQDQAVLLHGFVVGNSATVNTIGTTYYWTAYGNAWSPETKSGASDFFIGAYYGNGLDNRNIKGLPYQADLVVTKVIGYNYAGVFKTSAQGSASTDLSGFFTATNEAADYIQALNSEGFQVGVGGASRMTNYAAYPYFYFGFKANNSTFAVGTYDGTDSTHDVTGLGFQPDNVWVKRIDSSIQPVQRTSSMADNSALPFLAAGNVDNAITGIVSDGFTVYGSTPETNAAGSQNYRYVAWTMTPGSGTETPIIEKLMRHGGWFNSSGVRQPYTFQE